MEDATRQSDAEEEEEEEEECSYLMQEEALQEWAYEQTLSARQKRKYARLERDLQAQDASHAHVPLRFRILGARGLPAAAQAQALKKYRTLCVLEDPAQFCKLRAWLEGLLRIPFGQYHRARCASHRAKVKRLCETKEAMDRSIHGHAEAKESIVHMVSQALANPHSLPQIIGIVGPPGNGKTTLVRQGVARALQRPFLQVSLGGANDVTQLTGHAYTYENSSWGKVVDVLMEARCLNPVVYFDELDKVSQSEKGEEIISALIHMTDPSQNTDFRDHYFEQIPLDLSQVVFIFSFNDDKNVSPVLLDRLYLIRTLPLQPADKVVIASQHLLPAVARNVGFQPGQLQLTPDGARFLLAHAAPERGVRQLRRCLENIVLRLNTMKLLREASQRRTARAQISAVLGTIQCPAAGRITEQLRFPLRLTADFLRQVARPRPASSHDFMYT